MNKIRDAREKQELTQEQLASRAGINRAYLSRLENSRQAPTTKILHKIANALGVDIRDLV